MKLVPILIAEDDDEDRFLIKESLIKCRLANDPFFVNDGVEALEYLRNTGKYAEKEKFRRPGLVLLDLNMPKKGGLDVLKEIRADPSLCTIPVVILTTSKGEEDLLNSYKIGANSFISKPVGFDSLVRVMSSLTNYWFGVVELPGEKY